MAGGTGRCQTATSCPRSRRRHGTSLRSCPNRNRAAAVAALTDLGYELVLEDGPRIRLRNCPFRAVADISPELVCGMNRELVAGLLEGMGLDDASVALGGAPGDCCVIARLANGS